jgi:hypothetical protein
VAARLENSDPGSTAAFQPDIERKRAATLKALEREAAARGAYDGCGYTSTKKLVAIFSDDRQAVSAFRTNSFGTFIHELFMCWTLERVGPFGCCGGILRQPFKGGTTMVTKIGIALALVAFLAAPTASFAASKKSHSDQPSQSVQQSQSTQGGPYTPDIVTKPHGASRDFQGGSIYYKRSKTKKHGIHSPANS